MLRIFRKEVISYKNDDCKEQSLYLKEITDRLFAKFPILMEFGTFVTVSKNAARLPSEMNSVLTFRVCFLNINPSILIFAFGFV
jgi:hypothetical protein